MSTWASLEEALTVGFGVERSFVCPENHSNNAHASVNSITGWWYCYSCGAKGHADLERMDVDPWSIVRQVEKAEASFNRVHETFPETYLNLFDATGPGPYWLSRFTEQACRSWRLGQALDGSYATMPMRDHAGTVLGVIRRDLTGQDMVKYRYPSGLTIGQYLGGYHRAHHDVVLMTEGLTDAVAATEAADCSPLTCYGSSLSYAQADLLKKYAPRKILVAFDQDDAGQGGFQRIYDRMHHYFPVERLWWEDYKDLASIPLTERAEMLRKVLSGKPKIRVVKTGDVEVGSAS